MAANTTEKDLVTGLDQAEDRKEAERDLVTSLLEAAEFKTSEDNITEADIKRNGKVLFSVHLHPISEPDARFARKKATNYMPNPNNKKLPPVEKDLNSAVFSSWLIYLATTEEDQKKIWGNPSIMQKFDLKEPVASIDILLTYGEKQKLADLVGTISGFDDDDDETMSEEDYAKN
jgi:hypothetical protein